MKKLYNWLDDNFNLNDAINDAFFKKSKYTNLRLLITGILLILFGPFIAPILVFFYGLYFLFVFIIYNIKNILKYIITFKENKERKKFFKNINNYMLEYEKTLNEVYILKNYWEDATLFNQYCSLEEFIINFFKTYNQQYSTFSLVPNKRICTSGRRRSLGDIYQICKHYYPNCTLKEVFLILIKLHKKDKILYISKCNDIKKYVFYYSKVSEYTNLTKPVEYFNNLNIEISMESLIKYYK